jgi:hypothetical protein
LLELAGLHHETTIPLREQDFNDGFQDGISSSAIQRRCDLVEKGSK